ncbi:MAG TPA: CoA transferase [Dehalococcoidia bacterium]|nr:CoA transferase [Dehalococcoidia bacterium]
MTALRLLETSRGIAGAFAGQLFADHGTDVVKVEPPEGDATRERASGGLFASLNRGKRSVSIDLDSSDGRERLRTLVQWCDAVVCGPELAAAGIDDDQLREWNPRAIRSWVVDFGLDGPYAGYEAESIQLLALGGIMGITGTPRREPLSIPGDHPAYIAGIHAYTATAAALLLREREGGEGQRVETTLFEAVAATAEMACTLYNYTGAVRARFHGRVPWGIQGEVLPCKDGHIGVHPGTGTLLAILIDRPELVDDPLFTDPRYRLTHAEDFFNLLRPFLAAHTRKEIITACDELGVPFGAVLEVPDLLKDEQLIHREYFLPTAIDGREVVVPGPAFRTSNSAAASASYPAIGEHSDETFEPAAGGIGSTSGGQPAGKPLAGVRIVDVSWVWAGPAASRILADLGAEVVKIESPRRPDTVRALVQDRNEGHPDYWDYGGYFIEKNLGKRAITLDLNAPEGKEVFLQLVADADVVMESFRPRVMEQFGLGYDQLLAVSPELVMVSLSGYGQDGPARNRTAYGHALEPESGITSTIGYAGERPIKSGLAYTDPISGVLAAGAIVHALQQRESGERKGALYIDLAERDAVLPFMAERIVDYQLSGELAPRLGNRHERFAPQGCYACAGNDRWVAITARDDDEWTALARLVGAEQLAGLDLPARRERVDELDAAIGTWCETRDPFEVMELLQASGVPAAVVQNGRDLLRDPQLRGRDYFFPADHPRVGKKLYHRFLGARFETFVASSSSPAPLLDEHTDEVLGELGYDADQIAKLRADAVSGHQLEPLQTLRAALAMEWLLEQGAITELDPIPDDPWLTAREPGTAASARG